MTGMMPSSGVPATDAHNTILDPNTVNCNELWYSTTRCQPRFDPAAANAMLSELITLINCAGLAYDCSRMDNLCRAVRAMGDRCADLVGGPLAYTAAFDPPLSEEDNDCCTYVTVIPNVTNAGPVTINGIEVLRNDLMPLQSNDFFADVPAQLVYCNGKLIVPYFVRSQSPIEYRGQLDYWVRVDGSDLTGDGSANTPTQAFRTINMAFQTAMERYTRSPDMVLNIKLGIPGDYEGCHFRKFPGVINLTGDNVAPSGYRIHCTVGVIGGNCIFAEEATVNIRGVNLQLDAKNSLTNQGPIGIMAYHGSHVTFGHGRAELKMNGHPVSSSFFEAGGGNLGITTGQVVCVGTGFTIAHGLGAQGVGSGCGCGGDITPNNLVITWQSCTFVVAAYWSYAIASIVISDDTVSGVPLVTVIDSGCVGPEYSVTANSFIHAGGKIIPGATAGSAASGGQFIA